MLVGVPKLSFLMIGEHGDLDTDSEYRQAMRTLLCLSYGAGLLKRASVSDFGVVPLEGLWWANDLSAFSIEDKSAR